MRLGRAAFGLLLGCHPLPCLAVTAFATAYGAAMGAGLGRLGALAGAVLAGQLSVGWSNDAIDARRDRSAGRLDKPSVAGLIGLRGLAAASCAAFLGCVVLSVRLGAAAAAVHLVAVLSAIGYNAGLKASRLSPVPYLLSFGLLPAVVTFAVPPSHWPPAGQMLAAALLGGAAHFANTVGDAEADAATGVRGLPQRLGPRRSMQLAAGLVAAAALVLLVQLFTGSTGSSGLAGAGGSAGSSGAGPGTGRLAVAGLLLLGGVALATIGAVRRVGEGGGRGAFRLTLLAVALVIAGFLAAA